MAWRQGVSYAQDLRDRVFTASDAGVPVGRQIQRRLRCRMPVKRRAGDRNQFALPDHRQVWMLRLDRFPSPIHAHRPETLAKKSRSTTSWPILACSRSNAPSQAASFASARSENRDARPVWACRFHSFTIVG